MTPHVLQTVHIEAAFGWGVLTADSNIYPSASWEHPMLVAGGMAYEPDDAIMCYGDGKKWRENVRSVCIRTGLLWPPTKTQSGNPIKWREDAKWSWRLYSAFTHTEYLNR